MTQEQGELLTRFEADPAEERTFARVRLVSAVLATAGSTAMLLGKLPMAVFLVAALGLATSLLWLKQSLQAVRRAARFREHYLEVRQRGLVLSGETGKTWVSWDTVQDIDVDEERLDVVLARHGAPPVRIEPTYPGVEIHELMRTLQNAWEGRPVP